MFGPSSVPHQEVKSGGHLLMLSIAPWADEPKTCVKIRTPGGECIRYICDVETLSGSVK